MTLHEQIRIVCAYLGISQGKFAENAGMTRQAFSNKIQRDSFSPSDVEKMAEANGCKYETFFILQDGRRVPVPPSE